jgi:competence protein ComEA
VTVIDKSFFTNSCGRKVFDNRGICGLKSNIYPKFGNSGELMFHFDRIQQKLLLVMGAVILILSGILVYREYVHRVDSPVVSEQQIWETTAVGESRHGAVNITGESNADEAEAEKAIKVYITGRVKFKGLITLAEGDRVADAIELAGGALPDADLSRINLALKVKDEDMIYVPAVGEEIPSASHGLAAGSADRGDGKVNINKADQALLETLNGIGPSKAQKIIKYREENGGFQTIEEIMNVSGIGEKTYEGLKDQIIVE